MISDDERRKYYIKLSALNHELSTENRKKRDYAIVAGICIAGAVASVLMIDAEASEVVKQELQSIQSWPGMAEYFQNFVTPGFALSVAGAVTSIAGYIKHNDKYNKANAEFYAETDMSPEAYDQHFNGQR